MAFSAFDPAHDEDGLTIVLKEPRQSWKANLTWGLLLGVPAATLPWFAGSDADPFEKYGTVLIGLAWLAFMGASAYRNFGRTVRCDMEWITMSQAFKSFRVALADVASITREDVRQSVRDFDNIGVSRIQRSRQLDTMAPVVMQVLRDAGGQTLLRLDKDMEPASEMRRFLARIDRAIRARRPAA